MSMVSKVVLANEFCKLNSGHITYLLKLNLDSIAATYGFTSSRIIHNKFDDSNTFVSD